MTPEAIARLDWAKSDGLLPAIVQHADDGRVLMLGYMTRDALAATLATRRVTFHSRSRGRLWMKGETSGNVLALVAIEADCDRDALLVRARPAGPVCHAGTVSCFGGDARMEGCAGPVPSPPAPLPVGEGCNAGGLVPVATGGRRDFGGAASLSVDEGGAGGGAALPFLGRLDALVAERERERPRNSYTTGLFAAGVARIAQKLGEEAIETALAAVGRDDDGLLDESADLVFHLLVLLRARGLGLGAVADRLATRHAEAAGAR